MKPRSVDRSREDEVVVFRTSNTEVLARASSLLNASGIPFRVDARGGGHFGYPEHVFRLFVHRGDEEAARRALGDLPSEDIHLIERDPPPGPWRSIAWAYIVGVGLLILFGIAAAIWTRLR